MTTAEQTLTDSYLARLSAARGVDDLRRALSWHNSQIDPHKLTNIAIVGFAPEGRRLAQICRQRGITIDAVVDDDLLKVGTTIDGHMAEPTAALARLSRSTPIVIASHRLLHATKKLRGQGFNLVVPFALLQVLAPDIFTPHMFYESLLEDLIANRARYEALKKTLADDHSRRVLDAVLGFRETLDVEVLEPVVSESDLYAPHGLFTFGDHEAYIDGGAFEGDTIRAFIERVHGKFDGVYAFEPDPVTFAKLTANFANEPRVHPIHAGLYSRSGSLRFRDDASRGAIFEESGDIEMPVTTIDETVGSRPLTYIKMNIEGAEMDALRGGENSIRQWLPRLAISAYHRASDLWQIPRLVEELSPRYDLYLRQHDGGIIETVLYALPRAN
jgi:FkbM family methyltransferase